MYRFERNSRTYMKGCDESPGKSDGASKSPLGDINNTLNQSSNAIQHAHTNGNPRTHETKVLKGAQHRAVSCELGDLAAPGETKTKTQMAREFQETQELYKSADSKAGLQTVKTRRVLHQSTTITKGENEKQEEDKSVKIALVEEYRKLASRLLQWIKESRCKLEDRKFPKEIAALKKLKEANERFRTQDMPPKEEDKRRLASAADDVYKAAQECDMKIDDELHIDNINHEWDCMVDALRARDRALDDAIGRAELLKNLLDKLLDRIKKANERLDGCERDIDDEELRLARINTLEEAEALPERLQKINEQLVGCGIEIDGIKRMASEFIREAGPSDPDSIMIRDKVAELDGRYRKLLDKLSRLHKKLESALKHLRAQEGEAKLRLKLDAMKRRLDELERRIDNMGPVAKDMPTIRKQLAELQEFQNDLNKARDDLNGLCQLAEDMMHKELIADPIRLRADLKALKDQLARIEDKAARLMREFEQALQRADRQRKAEAEITLKLEGIKRELDELERRIDNMAPVAKDLPGLQRQLKEMQEFELDLAKTRRNLNDVVRLAEDMIRDDLISEPATLRANISALKEQLARIEDKAARRLKAIQDALNRAEAQKEAEAKYRLLLDQMQRELDQLERRIDNMAPVARDLEALQKQLDEINDFIKQLNNTGRNLNDLVKTGEDLIREDLIADPANLRSSLKKLTDQFARIEDKAARRLRDIQDAMSRVAASDAIRDVAKWLESARKMLIAEENVHGDLDTVNALIEQHKSFKDELAARQPTINEIRHMEHELSKTSPQNAALIREELNSLNNQWSEVEKLTRDKSAKLEEALRAAEKMHVAINRLLEWLAGAEESLRFAGVMPDDEASTRQELGEHERFVKEMAAQGQTKDQSLKLAHEILNKCHPDAEPVVKQLVSVVQSRWEEIEARVKQHGQLLSEHLRSLRELLALVEELIGWLTSQEVRLLGEEAKDLPSNISQLDAMIDKHSNFMDELRKREPDVARVIKIFGSRSGPDGGIATSKVIVTATTTKPRPDSEASSGRFSSSRSSTPTRTSYATYKDEYPEVSQPRARTMIDKWRSVWRLSLNKVERLTDRATQLKEMGRLDYQAGQLAQPERPPTDEELIKEEIDHQLTRCTCSPKFKVYHVGDGRYRFGDSQKLRPVRVQHGAVVVRAGGAWEQMSSFIPKNDPCRRR